MSIPEGATHKGELGRYYKCVEGQWVYSNNFGHWRKYYSGRPANLIALEKKHEWSGPQDGLPPVGTVCEYRLAPSNQWHECEIRYHLKHSFNELPRAVVWNKRLGFDQISSENWHFRAIKTPEQLAAEQRETAIREIMDVAGIDCLVTATRLADAGFKREVV